MKASKVRRRLQSSLDDRRIVTAVRDDVESWATDGFVIALTDDWVALHVLDSGVYLDDIAFLRLHDITRVWFRDDDAYHHRAIDDLGVAIETIECPDDADVAQLLRIAAARGGPLAIHTEVGDEGALLVGRLTKMRKKSFDLYFVGRDGVWRNDTERHRFKDVTRIQVGGRYLDALGEYADPYPEDVSP